MEIKMCGSSLQQGDGLYVCLMVHWLMLHTGGTKWQQSVTVVDV